MNSLNFQIIKMKCFQYRRKLKSLVNTLMHVKYVKYLINRLHNILYDTQAHVTSFNLSVSTNNFDVHSQIFVT